MRLPRRQFSLLLASLPVAAQTPAAAPELVWTDARTLRLEGLGFANRKAPFDRLPPEAEGVVPEPVWSLSRDPSGALVRFVSDAPSLHARWTVERASLAPVTMSATAGSGLDLYARDSAGRWRWLAIGRPNKYPVNEEALATKLPAGSREYQLYLPVRNPVLSLEIGVPKGASLTPGPVRPAGQKPIVFYGTSITHGMSASRAGMTHVAILGRQLNREVINLGFAGNGRMELEVTRFVSAIDAGVFVLDCLPNMDARQVRERAEPCVRFLRAAHPDTPILLAEDRFYQDNFLNASRRERNETNHAALREVFARMKAGGVKNIHYLAADRFLGDDGEGTVDGSHPTDLGFMRQAAEFAKALRPLLS